MPVTLLYITCFSDDLNYLFYLLLRFYGCDVLFIYLLMSEYFVYFLEHT